MDQQTSIHNEESRHEQHAMEHAGDESLTATQAAVECFKEYAKARPEVVALWAFGLGFVLGWKLKPW